jgi:hypothetical protein
LQNPGFSSATELTLQPIIYQLAARGISSFVSANNLPLKSHRCTVSELDWLYLASGTRNCVWQSLAGQGGR